MKGREGNKGFMGRVKDLFLVILFNLPLILFLTGVVVLNVASILTLGVYGLFFVGGSLIALGLISESMVSKGSQKTH